MNNFGKTECKLLRGEIKQALQELMKKHNISIEIGNMRYSANQIRCKVQIDRNEGKSMDITTLVNRAELGGRPKDDSYYINKRFTSMGKIYTVVEINRRRWKRPVIGQAQNGVRFVFTEDVLIGL